MSYCVSPQCSNPENHETEVVCRSCASHIILKERYLPVKPIGKGGFGKTFLAVDTQIPSQPNCVIKQLHFQKGDPEVFRKVVSLFRQEAIRLDQLGKHPQIPHLLAYFEQAQQLYLAQEFIEGDTLLQELQKHGVYKEAQIWDLLRDILPILQFIHDRQVIHRDLKPANIIRRRSDRRIVLIDFGVAKLFSNANLFQTGTIIGSPEYMPPEQTRGKVLPCSDLYSLGVTCIYLLTQIPPLDMFDIVDEVWIWRQHLPQGTKISDRLGIILDKLLQNSIKDRYQSAEEALEAVNSNFSDVNTAITVITNPMLINDLNVEVDSTRLKQLLSAGKWKEADEETWALMCQLVGKSPGRYIFNNDINKIRIQDLLAIDQLWLKYSSDRFGFSIQKQIYESVDREYNRFCDRVGWPLHQPSIPDSMLQFSRKAPSGHLPSRRWIGGSDWWKHAEVMANKLGVLSFEF